MDRNQLFLEIKQHIKDEVFCVTFTVGGFALLAITTFAPIEIFPSPQVWRVCHCAGVALITGGLFDLLDRLVLMEALERHNYDDGEL